jgi:hypothetical protein
MHGVKQIIPLFVAVMVMACQTTQTSDAGRVRKQSSSQLVAWLKWDNLPDDLKQRDPAFAAAVCHELVARREVGFLLASLNGSTNEEVRTHLISSVLYQIDDRRIYDTFAQLLTENEDEDDYFIASYLAKRGYTAALSTLNRHYYQYPVSSWQWSYTVLLFGKFKYMPATTNLVESLDAASLNVSAAACNALQKIYPDSPRKFEGPKDAEIYYSERLKGASHEMAKAKLEHH